MRARTMILADQLDEAMRPLPGRHRGIVAYNPLRYAWAAHERFLSLFDGPRRLIFVGMNPGPWGMVQTGVPFGSAEHARTILGLNGEAMPPIGHPEGELDVRPVCGLACRREEVSGQRFWAGLSQLWSPGHGPALMSSKAWQVVGLRALLAEAFVMNLCPLAFFETHGTDAAPNLTPPQLPKVWREPLAGDDSPSHSYFQSVVGTFEPEAVVVLGAWVEKMVTRWLPANGPRVVRLLHPSPASPAANRGWAQAARETLTAAGLVGR